MNASIHTGIALNDRLTPAQISQTISSGIHHAHNVGFPDWMGAIDALIEEAVAIGACFSSGELAAQLRTHHPSLVFSVTRDVGAHLRGRFQAGLLPPYGSGPVLQGSRATAGGSLSPIGTTVHVYGPDEHSINTHRFEVEVPAPGGTGVRPSAPRQAPASLAQSGRRHRAPCRSAAARRPDRLRVVVRARRDRRLCVPRWAFALLAQVQGGPAVMLQGGDRVYVRQDGDTIQISAEEGAGAVAHRLVTSRGRLLFSSRGQPPFVPGSRYTLTVSGEGICLIRAARGTQRSVRSAYSGAKRGSRRAVRPGR